jgi:hypothetical protein
MSWPEVVTTLGVGALLVWGGLRFVELISKL